MMASNRCFKGRVLQVTLREAGTWKLYLTCSVTDNNFKLGVSGKGVESKALERGSHMK